MRSFWGERNEDLSSRPNDAVRPRPNDTPFEDGTFRLLLGKYFDSLHGRVEYLDLEFTESYPNKPPAVRFTSKMFHPNGRAVPRLRVLHTHVSFPVYADGGICLDILQNRWSPTYDVSAILTSIQVSSARVRLFDFPVYFQSLLDEPNVSSPANAEAANLYQTNRRDYEQRVRMTVEQSWIAEPTLASKLRA